jgi:hypothetical protein
MRTKDELTVVCEEIRVPTGFLVEKGWRALKVQGPLEFSMIGVLATLAVTMAASDVSIFVLSSYDTDYILVKENDLDRAKQALVESGHLVNESV